MSSILHVGVFLPRKSEKLIQESELVEILRNKERKGKNCSKETCKPITWE